MEPATRTDEAFGVIPFRTTEKGIEVLMVKQMKGQWGFPKGHLERGESPQEAALRECKEETGLAAVIDEREISETYDFTLGNEPVRKTSTYWFASVETGDPHGNGEEISAVEWVPLRDASERTIYPSRKALIARVAAILEST